MITIINGKPPVGFSFLFFFVALLNFHFSNDNQLDDHNDHNPQATQHIETAMAAAATAAGA
jgi:hypothetical protein